MTARVTSMGTNPGRLSLARLLLVGLIAGIAAAVVNLIVYAVAKGLFDVPFLGPFGSSTPRSLPLSAIVLFSVVPAVLGAGLLAGLMRFVRRPVQVFLIIAAVFTLVSMIAPFNLNDTATSTKWSLAVMHVVAAAVICGALWGWTRERP